MTDPNLLFSETASRIIVSVKAENVDAFTALAASLDVACFELGSVGGDELVISIDEQEVLRHSVQEFEKQWREAIEKALSNV